MSNFSHQEVVIYLSLVSNYGLVLLTNLLILEEAIPNFLERHRNKPTISTHTCKSLQI